MERVIVFGDTHGRSIWKQIVEKEKNADKIIFIGDYFDSFDIKGDAQIQNFQDIIEFKKQNIDKVVLLMGNHDFHYEPGGETYSGFQSGYQFMISSLLRTNKDLLQMCYINENYLFTHAGVTKTWCKNILGNENPNKNVLEQLINDMFEFQPKAFNFTPGQNRSPYGDDICQTPIWVRPDSLRKDCIEGYIQVVGHTHQNNLKIEPNLILIDTLGSSEEYLVIENGKPDIGKLGWEEEYE